MKNLIETAKLRKALKPLSVLYFVISRNFIKWCLFKPLYRIEYLLSCGKFHKPHWSVMLPEKLKWLSRFNYKLCKLSMFYGFSCQEQLEQQLGYKIHDFKLEPLHDDKTCIGLSIQVVPTQSIEEITITGIIKNDIE